MDLTKFSWTRMPENYSITDKKITITTKPNTDLWQRTYYNFQNDNAPILQMETDDEFFTFSVKTDFADSKRRFDQCGLVIYLESENWAKCSVEYENGNFAHLGSVVTTNGFSDWATTEIDSNIKTVWYRLSRRQDSFLFECSFDGVNYKQMRIFHLALKSKKIAFGIYACSPENSTFTAVFSDFKLEECKWLAHS